MNTQTQRRFGAVLIAGGLVLAVSYCFFPSAYSPTIRWTALGTLIGVLLAVPGLVAFQAGQRARTRGVGWAGMAAIVVGLCLLEIPHSVIGVFDLDRMRDLDAYHASIWGSLEFVGLVVLAMGMLVLAVAMTIADSYHPVARLLLWANIAFAVLFQVVPSVGDALQQPAPQYLLMGLMGLAMTGRTAGAVESHAAASDATSAASSR